MPDVFGHERLVIGRRSRTPYFIGQFDSSILLASVWIPLLKKKFFQCDSGAFVKKKLKKVIFAKIAMNFWIDIQTNIFNL